MCECRLGKTFCEEVAELIACVDFQNLDPIGGVRHLFPEPMILDRVVLGSWGIVFRLKIGKDKCASIVFMYLAM